MPEFKLPTIKLPGFREMTTDDITQAIADVPRPNLKLADIADAAVAATQAAAKAAQEAAAAAQSAAQSAAERAPISPIRQEGRSRRPLFVLGMVVASLGLVALANADRIRRAARRGEPAGPRADGRRPGERLARTTRKRRRRLHGQHGDPGPGRRVQRLAAGSVRVECLR